MTKARNIIKVIPERIVKENTPDVDAVSGAFATSRAISEAVRKALKM
nr:FMN-binding protein [Lactobacillus paragasseri]